MGRLMGDDDVLIPGLFDLLNARFSPTPPRSHNRELDIDESYGGLDEMIALQREFQIFAPGRSFRSSAAIMNLGGFWSSRARNRWYKLLDDLVSYESNYRGYNGDQAVVHAIIDDLRSRAPLPVLFRAHDSRKEARMVLVGSEKSPVFYIDTEYLTISLPMRPRTQDK
jgi:hypothetical protein